jgi:hypothetical protein
MLRRIAVQEQRKFPFGEDRRSLSSSSRASRSFSGEVDSNGESDRAHW